MSPVVDSNDGGRVVDSTSGAWIAGPWGISLALDEGAEERGVSIVAELPGVLPGGTPTRGMVAWVHSGVGACEDDATAVATGRFIAAAPELYAALDIALRDIEAIEATVACKTHSGDVARAALARARGEVL
jgi:hypothetical protein